MKKHFLIIVIASFYLTSSLFGQAIDLSLAQTVATSKIENLGYSDSFELKPDADLFYDQSKNPLFFAFQLDPIGYVMVSANQLLPPVIAYSFTNDYKSKEHESNTLLELITNDLKTRLHNIDKVSKKRKASRELLWNQLIDKSSQESKKFEQWPPTGTTSTGGWLETNWEQGAPYNNFCPMDPVTNLRSIAGCPSVAIAMLINYYETLNETEFNDVEDDYYHSYSGRNYWVDDDFEEIEFLPFPDINAYFDTIADRYTIQSPLKTNEESALIWACGIAAKQVYTSSISGTFGVEQAYDAFLRFGFLDAKLLDGDNPEILLHFAENMMEARPTLLAVIDPGVAGHNLVTDGYNTDGYFHLNFGWGGSYNGWYLIPDEIPYNLTVFEGVIVDIAYPPVNTSVETPITALTKVNVYPIPATENLVIEWNMESSAAVTIEIADLNGKTCFKKQIDKLPSGKQRISVSINHDIEVNLSPGVYFCKVITNEESITKKVIIQ